MNLHCVSAAIKRRPSLHPLRFLGRLGLLALVCHSYLFLPGVEQCQAGGGPSGYIVVYDPSDPNSVTVANSYQQIRGIPERNMIPYPLGSVLLNTKSTAWDLAEALRAELVNRGLSAQMQGIALLGPVSQVSGVTGGTANGTSIQSFLYLSPNYERTTYPTQIGTPVNYAFRKPPFQPTAVVAGNTPINGWSYWPISYVCYTGGGGNSPKEVLDYLAKAKAADGSKPNGAVYWPVSTDSARNVRKSQISEVVPMWRALGIRYEVSSGSWVSGRRDVIGGILGVATIDPNQGGTEFLPGSWADSLTSFGGSMAWEKGQIKAAEWLRGGAFGSSGTVSEPYNSTAKFTHGHIHTHFKSGASLAEAFWQSIERPAEIISLGDPLLQPFADLPEVAITSPGDGDSIQGIVNIAVSALATGGKTLEPNLDLFIDGRRVAIGESQETVQASRTATGFTLDTATIGDGWHEIRVVAYNNDPVRTQNEAAIGVVVVNGGASINLTGPGAYNPDEPVSVTATPSGAANLTAIELRLNGRVLATLPPSGGIALLNAGLLPYDGNCSLYAIGIRAGDGTLSSPPLQMTADWPVQPPVALSGQGLGCVRVKYFASTQAADFHWDRTAPTAEVISNGNGTDGLSISTGAIPGIGVGSYATNPGFEFDMLFFAPAAEWYEFGCDASAEWSSLELAVNGRRVPLARDQLARPVNLAAGWHRLRIRGVNVTKSASLKLYERRSSQPLIEPVPPSRLISADPSPAGEGLPPQITGIGGTAEYRSFRLAVTATNPSGPESDLIYGWGMAEGGAEPSFTPDGTNAAKNTTTGILKAAGTYTFTAYARNQWGTATATVTVVMPQTASSVQLSGVSSSQQLVIGEWYPVRATVIDQFSRPMQSQPSIAWSVSNASAEVETTGPGVARVRALDSNSSYTLRAEGGGFNASAGSLASVSNTAPTFGAPSIQASYSIPSGGPGMGLESFKVAMTAVVSDPDDANRIGVTYLWEVVSAPPGETLTIAFPTGMRTTAEASGPGEYTVRATVSDASGATVVQSKTFTIDSSGGMGNIPVVKVTATDPAGSESGADPVTFTIARTGSTASDLSLRYNVLGSATAADYQPLSGYATIPAGAASTTVTVLPVDDGAPERDETVAISLITNYSYSYYVGEPAGASGIIRDNDLASNLPVISVSASDSAAVEGVNDPGRFTVTRTGPTTAALLVSYTTSGTALNGTDHQLLPGAVVIPAGSASAILNVTSVDDDEVESAETVVLKLSAAADYTLGGSVSATVNMEDNDLPPVVAVAATDAAGSEEGPNTAVFTISRAGATSMPLSVEFTIGGTATEGEDFEALPRVAIIPAGQASTKVKVTPVSNGIAESAETVILTLLEKAAYTIGSPASGTATITDEAPPPLTTVTIGSTDRTASETGRDPAVFTIDRSGATSEPLTVNFSVGGTATEGQDYETLPRSVIIPSGRSLVTLPVTPKFDPVYDPNETVVVTLSPNAEYTLGTPNSVTLKFLDQDQPTETWNGGDIGGAAPGYEGSVTFDEVANTYTISGAGVGITGAADGFYMVRRMPRLSGDGSIVARVDGITSGGSTTKVGVMMRETSEANARFTLTAITPASGVLFQRRVNTGASSSSTTVAGLSAPRWLKLTRTGDLLTSAYSSDGQNWVVIGTAQTVVMAAEIEVGLCISSGSANALATAVFSEVSVSGAPGTGAVEIIMDNGDVVSGVTISSGWTAGTATSGYIAANYLTDGNSGKGSRTVRFTPTIPLAGEYEIYARWTAATNRAANVPISIQHAGAVASVSVNQQSNGGSWQRLGGVAATYPFDGGASGYVEISNTGTTAYVIADAMRFVRKSGLPEVTVTASDPDAAEEGLEPGMVRITRTGPIDAALTVHYSLGGGAAEGVDYTVSPAAGTILIPSGQMSATVVLTPVDDQEAGDKTVVLTLSPDAAYAIGASISATVNIVDNDSVTVAVAATGATASEEGLTGNFTVTRTGANTNAMTVGYTLEGTATSGLDYVALSGSVIIPAGESSATIEVIPVLDDLLEGAESVRLVLAAGSEYVLGTPDHATVVIEDRPLDAWRLNEFGSDASNPAIAGDMADPDGDGISNLMEYALGFDPNIAGVAEVPGVSIETIEGKSYLTLTYRKLRMDVLYRVEGSVDLEDWSVVEDAPAGSENGVDLRKATVPADESTRFLRLKITRP